MNPQDVIVEALRIIDESNVPDDLRVTAFAKAIDLLCSGNGKQPELGSLQKVAVPTTESSVGDLVTKIAVRLDIAAAVVAEVFEQVDNDIRVIAPPKKFDKAKMGATKQMGLLVSGGRQAAGLEDSTTFDKVREAAEDYGIYDQNNFARTLADMGDDFIVSGSGRLRSIRLRRPAWDKTKELVSRMGGDE